MVLQLCRVREAQIPVLVMGYDHNQAEFTLVFGTAAEVFILVHLSIPL